MDFTEAAELSAALQVLRPRYVDVFTNEVYSTSPDNDFTDLLIDIPTRMAGRPDTSNAPTQQRQQQSAQKCKSLLFESNVDGAKLTLLFPKVAVKPIEAIETIPSELAKIFPTAGTGESTPSTGPTKKYKIFLPDRQKLVVDAPVKCSVEVLIQATLDQYKGNPPLKPAAAAYELRVLEDMSGTPDMDFPALERNRLVHDVGDDSFAMVVVANYKDDLNAPKTRERKESQWSAGLKVSSGSFMKVHLPDKTSLALHVDPEQTMQQVLQIVARKRGLKIDDFFFESLNPEDDLNSMEKSPRSAGQMQGIPIDMTLKVKAYGKDEVRLAQKQFADRPVVFSRRRMSSVPRTQFGQTEDSETVDAETSALMMNRFTAGQYKEYHVIKINHHGTREERIMGIDSEHVTNNMPKTGGLFGGIKSKVASIKRPQRPISDVITAQLDTKNPKLFHLTFRGEGDKSSPRAYTFEAVTDVEAAEVVAKIRFLRTMLKSHSMVAIKEVSESS